jgi:hypothetical protein
VPLSTGGGILSTKAVRLVRLVRSGGPGFVPFLFPGSMPASKATDVGRTTDASGNPLRAGLTDTTSGGSALTCDVLVWGSSYGLVEGSWWTARMATSTRWCWPSLSIQVAWAEARQARAAAYRRRSRSGRSSGRRGRSASATAVRQVVCFCSWLVCRAGLRSIIRVIASAWGIGGCLLESLPDDFQSESVQARERGQVRAGEGSVTHVAPIGHPRHEQVS